MSKGWVQSDTNLRPQTGRDGLTHGSSCLDIWLETLGLKLCGLRSWELTCCPIEVVRMDLIDGLKLCVWICVCPIEVCVWIWLSDWMCVWIWSCADWDHENWPCGPIGPNPWTFSAQIVNLFAITYDKNRVPGQRTLGTNLGQRILATVSSHNCNSQHFNLRISNPKATAYVHFNMPFESSNLPASGPIFTDWAFENWPYGPCGPQGRIFRPQTNRPFESKHLSSWWFAYVSEAS